jgi:hypothetical protein
MGIRLQLSNAQGVGDNALAGKFNRLWITLGEAASLWTRKEPLCPHEIERFDVQSKEFATLYAELFPEQEPTPKLHILMYHVLPQMKHLGGSGILHEGVVEAFHVVDNRHVARWANVKDSIRNITLRARASWQISNPGAQNIRSRDHDREERRRERVSVSVRGLRDVEEMKHLVQKQRLARLARDEEVHAQTEYV